MNSDLLGMVKMRGSVWGLLFGLAAGIAAYLWGAGNETPETRAMRDCAHGEQDHYTGERPGGHIPLAVYQAALEKCARELRAKASASE
jgi:hypothetical protein